ncbi:MAG: Uma2 family endonuclease [Planctomycetaceae bacterium]|nr:Uma2 family endonuclease [Planctomycetaceae bacterium]
MSTVFEPTTNPPLAPQRLLTIEEYALLPDDGYRTELVRGKVVEMPPATSRHGEVCGTTGWILTSFARDQDRGRVLTNDSGIITRRNPDSLRGADVAFYSYARLPKGPIPEGYLQVAPEIVFEVKSPDDRWTDIIEKVGEYLAAGVLAVCVLEPAKSVACVYRSDEATQTFTVDQTLELPEPLADFRIPVARFFE